jgi:hypothetical protein
VSPDISRLYVLILCRSVTAISISFIHARREINNNRKENKRLAFMSAHIMIRMLAQLHEPNSVRFERR